MVDVFQQIANYSKVR